MAPLVVDVVVIGAGTAGLNARRSAETAGATAVMVDPGPYGTTCARVGCMPSKLLIAPAGAVHKASMGGVFGFEPP
jgi:dihydrolipoamide dehydrogenase